MLAQSASGASRPALRPGASAAEAGAAAGAEQASLCEVVCRLVAVHGLAVISRLPGCAQFFEQLCGLTCRLHASAVSLARASCEAAEGGRWDGGMYEETEGTWLTDSVDQLTACWTLLSTQCARGDPISNSNFSADRCGFNPGFHTGADPRPGVRSLLGARCNAVFRAFVESRAAVNALNRRTEAAAAALEAARRGVGPPGRDRDADFIGEMAAGYGDEAALGEAIEAAAGLGRFAGASTVQWLRSLLLAKQRAMREVAAGRPCAGPPSAGARGVGSHAPHASPDDAVDDAVSRAGGPSASSASCSPTTPGEDPSVPAAMLASAAAEPGLRGARRARVAARADVQRLQAGGRGPRAYDGLALELLQCWRRIVRSYMAVAFDGGGGGAPPLLQRYAAGAGPPVPPAGADASQRGAGAGADLVATLVQHAALSLALGSAQAQLAGRPPLCSAPGGRPPGRRSCRRCPSGGPSSARGLGGGGQRSPRAARGAAGAPGLRGASSGARRGRGVRAAWR